MVNMTDLEWLALNVCESDWYLTTGCKYACKKGSEVWFAQKVSMIPEGAYYCNKEQWQAERKRLGLDRAHPAAAWDEERIDQIAQNGATAEHYNPEDVAFSGICSDGGRCGEGGFCYECPSLTTNQTPTSTRPDSQDLGQTQDGVFDLVKNPKHYALFPGTQAIDIIEAALTPEEFAGYCKGNALKYRLRAGEKGDIKQDIDKSNWYRDRLSKHGA